MISGMRQGCDVAIWVDMRQAMQDGIKFYISKNGVILTSGVNGWIGKQYFLRAKYLRTGQLLRLDA